MRLTLTYLRLTLAGLLLFYLQSCSQRPADLPIPATTAQKQDITISEAQTWYQNNYASAASSSSSFSYTHLVWARALTVGQGAQKLVLVPLSSDQALFAKRRWQGTRYLAVTKNANQTLDGNLLELLLRRATTPIDTVALFTNLYRSNREGGMIAPAQGEGYLLAYTPDYHYLYGRHFRDGRLFATIARLKFFPSGTTNQGKNSTVKTLSACIDWYNASTGEYITTTGDCYNYVFDGGANPTMPDGGGSTGSGDPGTGGYGGSGGGGSGPDPVTSVPNMPKTMKPQLTPGTCVPASLAEVKAALCGNGQTPQQIESAMDLYAIQQYGTNFLNDGMPLAGVSDFINHYFNTGILYPAGNFNNAIASGIPVMIDIFEYMDGQKTAVYHSVVVTGYNPSNVSQVYYLDPATGTTQTADAATLYSQSHYAIPITGCK